jgi:hypothetical protein
MCYYSIYFNYGTKEGFYAMRDWELEKLADKDIGTALEYIGETARSKNIFLGNSSKKPKTHSLYSVPLFLSHESKKSREPKSCH